MLEGGAFNKASSNRSGPAYFMDAKVILVTLNYRVGALGFLSTEDSAAPGNAGLKDQVLALRWVRRNIAAFGGHPYRVTLMGQSAGGSAVTLHLLSEMSKGLFSAAISQSGSFLTPRHWKSHLRPRTEDLALRLGCPANKSAEMIECLQKKDVKEIVLHQNDVSS
jgi:carboxylesterase type B